MPSEFIKYHGVGSAHDWRRAQLLHEICLQIDGLHAPEPLRLDREHQTITYRFIPNLKPIVQVGRVKIERMVHLGHMLARFHDQSSLHPALVDPAHYELMDLSRLPVSEQDRKILQDSLPIGFFHADCWHGNVFFQGDDVVLLDPVPYAAMFPQHRLLACTAIDVATLHMSILACHKLATHAFISDARMLLLADAMLHGYLGHFGARHAAPAVVRLSLLLAHRWTADFPRRLSRTIAALKRWRVERAIRAYGKHGTQASDSDRR